MKKAVLVFSMVSILLLSGVKLVSGQEKPAPKKDTVNMDTNAKPTFYYATEDEKKSKGSGVTIAIIAGAVVVVGAAAFFLLKKKK
jgi:LPXTG-motif cell wall-anchored protein